MDTPLDTGFFVAWLRDVAEAVRLHRDRLTELDAAIGDADHGTNLDRGFTEVRKALDDWPPTSPVQAMLTAGETLIRRVGGASGPLYGSAFRQFGKALQDLQEGLGGLNDLATAEARLASLGLADTPAAERFLSAWETEELLEDATKARHELLDVKPFWR